MSRDLNTGRERAMSKQKSSPDVGESKVQDFEVGVLSVKNV